MATVTGLADLQKNLRELGITLEKDMLRSALREGGKVVAQEARLRAPIRADVRPKRVQAGVEGDVRRPGNLRRSIRVRIRTIKGRVAAVIGTTKRAFYAVFKELGSAHQPPEPFLRPAADSKQGETLGAIEQSLRNQLRLRFQSRRGIGD